MYTLTCYSSEISVDEYLENYVDIPTFAKAAYGHFPRPAGPHFPDSLGHIKRTAQ